MRPLADDIDALLGVRGRPSIGAWTVPPLVCDGAFHCPARRSAAFQFCDSAPQALVRRRLSDILALWCRDPWRAGLAGCNLRLGPAAGIAGRRCLALGRIYRAAAEDAPQCGGKAAGNELQPGWSLLEARNARMRRPVLKARSQAHELLTRRPNNRLRSAGRRAEREKREARCATAMSSVDVSRQALSQCMRRTVRLPSAWQAGPAPWLAVASAASTQEA